MYKVTLKGTRDPLFIQSDDEGMKVKNKWVDPKVDKTFKFAVHDKFFEKSKIDMIEYVKATPTGQNDDKLSLLRQDLDLYRSWISKKPEQKANRITMWESLYRLLHLKEPPPPRVEALKKDLIQFFTDNPKRTYADVDVYAKHIANRQHNKKLNILHDSYLKMMGRVINNDREHAQFIKADNTNTK